MADANTIQQDRDSSAPEELQSGFSREKLHDFLRAMLLFRRFEERAEEAYAIGKIGGFCHLHIGQEAAAVGSILPLRKDDYAIGAYREHTQAIAKGVEPRAVMAELYGKATGCSGGLGGSMHMFDRSVGFMGGHGIVGAQTGLALGMGWAIKYRGGDQVCICFMGDAAVNQGGFHESMNMAAVWNLPVIFVVENNHYGMGTKFSRVSRNEIVDKAASHGVPAHTVNGQDVVETYTFFADLFEQVRGGAGPQYVDMQCYRFKGHSMSDPVSGTYRSKEEVDAKIENDDPILTLRDRLFEAELLTQDELEAMDAEVRAVADEAVEFAEGSPEPKAEAMYDFVYSEVNEHGRLFFDGRGQLPSGGTS
jgi:pyruvate dehydrogenase E1 component subunit alpha